MYCRQKYTSHSHTSELRTGDVDVKGSRQEVIWDQNASSLITLTILSATQS